MMLIPVFTLDDGTEITASRPDEKGNITLYVEKIDKTQDSFASVSVLLPGTRILSCNGYSPEDAQSMAEEFLQIQEDIIGYVKEKTNET